MEKISFNRKELYEKIWSIPMKELCDQIDLDPHELERICGRLNVPVPERTHWKKLADGKKVAWTPLPEKSKGTEAVTLFEKNDEKLLREQIQKVDSILKKIDPAQGPLKDYSFDKLVLSTKEGMPKHWEQAAVYWEKSRMLDIRVSPEARPRALQFMDLLIKVLRFKGHQLIAEKHQMFAVVNDERIELSLREKEKRVEYVDEYGHVQRDNRPTGFLFLKREGRAYESRGWADGPKKGAIEEQILIIIDELVEIAREQKEERERWKKSQEQQAKAEKVRRAHEEKQRNELARFRGLLLNAHRFQLAEMVREYVNAVEVRATSMNEMTDEMRGWILWAKKRADWYDPTLPREENDLLEGIDVENLHVQGSYYSSFGVGGYGETENKFWKPWWLK